MKIKLINWVDLLKDGNWREIRNIKNPVFCSYLWYRAGVKHEIKYNPLRIRWELFLNGMRVASGDLSQMLLRSNALAEGVDAPSGQRTKSWV